MRKFVAAVAAAAVVIGGGVVASAVATPATAQAQETEDSTTQEATRVNGFSAVLDALVTEGVITQVQADTVEARIAESGFSRFSRGGFSGRHLSLDAVADVIGVTSDDLRTALQGGQSLGEIAADNGVDRQVIVDTLTTQLEERLAEAVADERITQEEADEKLASSLENIEAVVDGEASLRGFGGHRHHGRGFGGGELDDSTDADASEAVFNA